MPNVTPRTDPITASEIADWLRNRIRRGQVVPGQRLVETDIIRATGGSRARVREALQRLEAEGIVLIEEFRGASVRDFSPQEIAKLYRARIALEGLAAHDFAAFGEATLKAELAAVQEQMNALEGSGDHPAFAQLNDAWHEIILDGADNEHIRGFVHRLRLPLHRMLFMAFYKPHRIDDANAGHRKVTAAILAGDGPAAEAAMRAHIEEASAAVAYLTSDQAG